MAYFEKLDINKDCPCSGCDLSCPENTCEEYEKWLSKNETQYETVEELLKKSREKTEEYIRKMKYKNRYNKF
jgi:hypothetical protein